jgi:hypothetical protein
MIVPGGSVMFSAITLVAFMVLFLVAKWRAKPDPVNGKPLTPAESRQKLTKLAHH